MKRWSKLKKQIEDLFDEDLNLEFIMEMMRFGGGNATAPILKVCLNKEEILKWPSSYCGNGGYYDYGMGQKFTYGMFSRPFYYSDITTINATLGEYHNIPKEKILDLSYSLDSDPFGMFYIQRAADRRIGKDRLRNLYILTELDDKIIPPVKSAVLKILNERLK